MGIGIGTLLAGGTVVGLLQNSFPPLHDYWSKTTYDFFPTKILPPAEILSLYYRGEISETDFQQYLKENGFDPALAELLFISGQQKLGVNDYIHSWRRGLIDEKTLTHNLKGLRLNDEDITLFKKVSEFFPSPADLVSFAVREVYTEDIRQRFGLDQDRPEKFIEEAQKAGLPVDQAKNYWAAHWQLPSPLQGFEMMHRKVISEDDLTKLLKALDIVPFWREKLQQISYSPLTRVDVRRMYGMGVIDVAGVHKAYMDIGYNEENARLMTEFTQKYENESGNDITRSAIIKAYKKDIIDEEQALEYLLLSGYNEDTAKFYMSMAEFEKLEIEIEEYINELQSLYLLGEISIDEIRVRLNEYDLPAIQINSIIRKLTSQTSKKIKKATKGDLENWLKLNIIDEREYFSKMLTIGYSEQDIRNYLTEINIEVDTSQRKYLPIKTYFRWFSSDILTENEFILIAKQLKIGEKDIERFIDEVQASKFEDME